MQAVGQPGVASGFCRVQSASRVSAFPLFPKLPQDKGSQGSQRGAVLAAKLLDISNSNLDTGFTVAALLRVRVRDHQ